MVVFVYSEGELEEGGRYRVRQKGGMPEPGVKKQNSHKADGLFVIRALGRLCFPNLNRAITAWKRKRKK